MKIQPAKIAIFIISFLVFLFLAEKIISKFAPQKTYNAAYSNSIRCFNKSDLTIFELKPNCNMNLKVIDDNKDVIAHLNSHGIRGEEFLVEKKENEKRILIEGDSFILGWGVEDDEVLAKILEDKLGGKGRVINAGYAGGLGPDGYYLHLKNTGMKFSPDLVVFSIFVSNDFDDLKDSEWIGIGKYGEPKRVISNRLFVDDNGVLIPKIMPGIYKKPILKNSHLAVLAFNTWKKAEKRIIWAYDRVRFSVFPPEIPSSEPRDSNLLGNFYSACTFGDYCHRKAMHLFDDLLAVVKAARDEVEKRFSDGKVHFLVMIIPADFQINPGLSEKYRGDTGIPLDGAKIADPNPQKRLKEMFEKENIQYLDLLPEFRKAPENLYFPVDGHWNKEGHKEAALALYNWITTNYDNFSTR